MRFVQALTQITKPAVEECVCVNALPICLCECRKANVKTKVTHAFGLVDFHAYLNVCQKKEQMHFVSVSTSVSASVCVWMVTGGETVGYSIADKGGLSTLICVRVPGGVCAPQDYRQLSRRKISKRYISKFSNYITMCRCNTQIKLSNIHPEQAYAFDL